ncbi:MAG: SIMPL domain-containing protein [Ignavibacteriae bacterium HGW-Ignavibacteriae-3]|nr:MAG: SIMPL domain-containing protein [Ignavibacteriae bacterium HGW-Ignavibacteriae-3]
MNEKYKYIIPISIPSAALILSVIIFSLVWKSAKNADQTITVTGSAKKMITSDLGIQRGTIQATSYDRRGAYQLIQQQMPVVLKYLAEKGLPKDQIEVFSINGYPIFEIAPNGNQTQKVLGYIYSQRFEVNSNDVKKIKELSLSLSSLVEKGLDINVDAPEYLFTKLDDLKIEVQAAASKNAMDRAAKIAEATGRSLGSLRNARMGVIQITPQNSNVISDYGMNDVSSVEKEITAVVSAAFEIR